MKIFELLAPAGNKASFIGAINAGADAIYLSGKKFGARKFANNFTDEEIVELIQYAHIRNVKVFVTINTIIFQNEFDDVIAYSDFLVNNHVDALIVQDIGLITTLTKRYPNTEIHASTQTNTYTFEQAKALKDLGVSRIILARETSLATIKELSSLNIDLEVFIQGALCVSYSGNCLFSYMHGGRSGNRGECAQSCRLEYELLRDNEVITPSTYLLSTKDLSTINYLSDFDQTDVVSLKIEGRMRKEEYVITAVKEYKVALQNNQISTSKLDVVFNRQFTKGYVFDEKPSNIVHTNRPNHQGVYIGTVQHVHRGKVTILLEDTLSKNDGIRILSTDDIGGKVNRILWNNNPIDTATKGMEIVIDFLGDIQVGSPVHKTLDYNYNTSLEHYLDPNYKLIPINLDITLQVGKPIYAHYNTPYLEGELYSEYIIQPAQKVQDESQIKNVLNTFGGTPYYLQEYTIDNDGLGFIPNAILKQFRRELVDNIEHSMLKRPIPSILVKKPNPLKLNQYYPQMSVVVETIDQYNACKDAKIEHIYVSEKLHHLGYPVYLNRINSENYYDHAIIHDLGKLQSGVVVSEYMNIVNAESIAYLVAQGASKVTLSIENTMENIQEILKRFTSTYSFLPPVEVKLYGKDDLMITKYCPISKGEGIHSINCNICEKYDYKLQRDQKQYAITRDSHCNVRIVNHKPHEMYYNIEQLKAMNIPFYRLHFTDENYEETRRIIQKYQTKLALKETILG